MIRNRRPREAGTLSRESSPNAPALDALADRVRRLVPSHRDPEAFYVEKNEIEKALRRLARRVS